MIKGIIGILLSAIIFAVALFLILHFLGLIAIIVGIIALGFVIGAIIAFILLLAFAFVLFFAVFYYLIEKKPIIQKSGNYTLSMEKEKGKEDWNIYFISFFPFYFLWGSKITFIDLSASATNLNPFFASFKGSLWEIKSSTAIFSEEIRSMDSTMSLPAPA